MDNHVWIDGPDGPGYHCPVCGVSRAEDYANSSCYDILRERGQMKGYLLQSFTEGERRNWIRWQRAQDEARVVTARKQWWLKSESTKWLKRAWAKRNAL